MNLRIILSMLVGVSMISLQARAADISDDVTDVEEITADSDAAKAEAKAAQARVEKERAETAKELKSVREARQTAQAKKVEAADTLKKTEMEMAKLASEQALLNKDIIRLNHEAMVNDRAIMEARAKLDKMKTETAALQASKATKQATIAESTKQKMQLMRDVGIADDEKAIQLRELERTVTEEKAVIADLEKSRSDEAVKKVAWETKIKDLKELIQSMRSQRKTLDADVRKIKAYNKRLEEQARVGAGELEKASGPATQTAQTTDTSP